MSDILTANVFPASIVRVMAENFTRLNGIDKVFRRGIHPIDPTRSIGVYSLDWLPEGAQIGQQEPPWAHYHVRVQCMIKHMSEEEGMAEHSVLSKSLRAMLYRDQQLRAELALTDTSFGTIERLKDFHVQMQRFMTNEINGAYVYLSYMDVAFRVEQTRI